MSNNFWTADVTENMGSFEMGGGEIEPIPNKTQVLAFIDEIKWDTYADDTYISARWNIIKPEEYKNRKIFQKIRVKDNDTKKAEKAKRMLMAIDFNAKGGLAASGKEPTTELMQSKLTNRPMVIMLQIWALEDKETGEMRKGNWISAVAPKGEGVPEKIIPVEIVKPKKEPELDLNDEADLAF